MTTRKEQMQKVLDEENTNICRVIRVGLILALDDIKCGANPQNRIEDLIQIINDYENI